jgi:ferritin-like metal-binding protein YciE
VPGKLSNPRDLLLQQLGEMLWVERMLAFEALPKLYRQTRMQSLKRAIERHLELTKEHVARVELCFRHLGAEPSSNRSAALAGLEAQHDELAEKIVEERLSDLFHATAAAQTERYEIGLYDAVIALLRALDEAAAAELLGANRRDEEEALEELARIARRLSEDLGTGGACRASGT